MTVLPEYTDEHLTEGAERQDGYGRRCRALLKLPPEDRQAAWAEAYRETHHTPTEWRASVSGELMPVAGLTQIIGNFTEATERAVNRRITPA